MYKGEWVYSIHSVIHITINETAIYKVHLFNFILFVQEPICVRGSLNYPALVTQGNQSMNTKRIRYRSISWN